MSLLEHRKNQEFTKKWELSIRREKKSKDLWKKKYRSKYKHCVSPPSPFKQRGVQRKKPPNRRKVKLDPDPMPAPVGITDRQKQLFSCSSTKEYLERRRRLPLKDRLYNTSVKNVKNNQRCGNERKNNDSGSGNYVLSSHVFGWKQNNNNNNNNGNCYYPRKRKNYFGRINIMKRQLEQMNKQANPNNHFYGIGQKYNRPAPGLFKQDRYFMFCGSNKELK